MFRDVFALCLMALLSASAMRKSDIPQNAEACKGKPPTGTWLMDHFTPLTPTNATRVQHGRTVLQLSEPRENVFIADGAGLFYLSHVLDIYKGNVWDYHIGGIFNPKTCMFSGIVFNVKSEPLFPDAIEYFYDGEKLYGPCVFSIAIPGKPERTVFPQTAYHNATFTWRP